MKIKASYELTDYEGENLEDVLVAQAAARMVKGWEDEKKNEIRHRATTMLEEQIRERLGPLVEEALEAALNPTDVYGVARNTEPTTLHEIIVESARAELAKRDTSYHSRDRRSVLEEMIDTAVGKALRSDLSKAVKEAQAEIKKTVKDQAAEIIAETLTRAAGIR